MIPIKNIIYENGVKQIFKFIVTEGAYQGEYVIKTPEGWNEIDSTVNIDDTHFNVKDFIIGDSNKLTFTQYYDKIAYDVLTNVKEEQGGDGIIVFKWIAVKAGKEYDLLKDDFVVNLNKSPQSFDKTMFKIDVEIIKSEAQNKFFTRDDTTVDLFALKDIDEKPIAPLNTFTIGYKKGDKKLANIYSYDISQEQNPSTYGNDHFMSFFRAENPPIGDNKNEYAGTYYVISGHLDKGPFISTNITLKKIEVEISNMQVRFYQHNVTPEVKLYAIIEGNGSTEWVYMDKSEPKSEGGENFYEIKIDNRKYTLENHENLKPGQSITFRFHLDNDTFGTKIIKTNTSIEISSNLESPLVKTEGVRLIDAIGQVIKNYTSSKLGIVSNILGQNGVFYNSSVSTGVYLRGLPSTYTVGQKIKTSFKNLFADGASKLLALGYDIIGNNVVVEGIDYFFKDVSVYDLSEKIYLQDDFKKELDKDVTFNTLIFGSKKYSTKVKDDIRNFITMSESSTPIKTVKNKFDKQTELIIDEYKIQELIEDNSSSTNDNDDDLVLIDMVNAQSYPDSGVFEDCIHSNVNGKLVLICTSLAFDTTMMEIGSFAEITEGPNGGIWQILDINGARLTLNKTSNIQEGRYDTPIKYTIDSLIKNRSINDGFTEPNDYVRNPETSSNSRHNPKYHMARWFSFFGSGLRKKKDSELIKVTNYKNNSKAQMKVNSVDLMNELQGVVVVGADETLGRLRQHRHEYFTGETIEISYYNISFEEFMDLYQNWRYGKLGNRFESRGYITLNTPQGLYDVYPYGDNAFSHSKMTDILMIKGKIKGKSIASPVLLSVNQLNGDTVTLTWDYSSEFINPKIDVQYSVEGGIWTTIKQVQGIKSDTIQFNQFNDIITGTVVIFRVIVSDDTYYNRNSNTLSANWKFNNYIITEVFRQDQADCGLSRLSLDITGTATLNAEWQFSCVPGGGKCFIDALNGISDSVSFTSPYGVISYNETKNTVINLNNETKRFSIDLFNSDKTVDGNILNCKVGDNEIFVFANLVIKIKDQNSTKIHEFNLDSVTKKKFN